MAHSRQDAPVNEPGHDAPWHFAKFVEFTARKAEVGEPSPHLAIVGHLSREMSSDDRLWMLGLYAATYCLPTALVLHAVLPLTTVRRYGLRTTILTDWLSERWPGVVTRTERRCVRSPLNMAECLVSIARWIDTEYDALTRLPTDGGRSNYDMTWNSVARIKFFGRYIAIRFIEGLRRYCGVPAMLYDIRSVGGWSPKRALCYLYPEHTEALLRDDRAGNALTDDLANRLLGQVRESLPWVNEYILAAMLCEYKAYYENQKQYPGWTIDQEPLLYDKVRAYWGDLVDVADLWSARAALFPAVSLGENGGWNGTRWPLTKTLRYQGYVWSDVVYDYRAMLDIANPVRRVL